MFVDQATVNNFYQEYSANVSKVRAALGRSLTFAEKILFAHSSQSASELVRGKSSLLVKIDRVAMQDATAQMAVLQFILTGREKVAVPTTIHCDHLIRAQLGASADLNKAKLENDEVYVFLKSAANKYGIGFWNPGSGIIHQVVLEKYAFPGGIMIGTDSHTPNAGGLGMVAIGVGGADAVDVMAGRLWNTTMPRLIGVKLYGRLNGWTSPKDIILRVAELLTVKGGTGCVVEYFGEGACSISATGKATIANMGAELGATTSIFPYDENTGKFLDATGRADVRELADRVKSDLIADSEVEVSPEKFFDQVIEIDLSSLEPRVVGPFTPDLGRPISKLGGEARANGWPVELKYCLIGSCTNSSYEDMQRAVSIARQAVAQGMKAKCGFLITPGSEQIFRTIKRDGLVDVFEQMGGTVLANACGPCIGQWQRSDVKQGEKNSIVTSYNRNFKERNDENPGTHAFIASPEIVTALALAGSLDFNPLKDSLSAANGSSFVLEPPAGVHLPSAGFVADESGYDSPTGRGDVMIKQDSDRLALLELFGDWHLETDFRELFVLLKAKGKCTTDHISPAGRWLAYRGHLDKISDNVFSGAVNAFTGEPGKGRNLIAGGSMAFSAVARMYKSQGRGWIVVGDENYGEGSSREHAAMEPRYFGCRAVIVKSFARIHEANLKKQGVLPLWLSDKNDYEKFREDDKITIDARVEVGKPVLLTITHSEGAIESISTTHTLTVEEIDWFKAGSYLNYLRKGTESHPNFVE